MPNHQLQPSALALTLVLLITTLSASAAESGPSDKTKLEQAAHEKRPADSEAGSTAKKIEPPVKILGLTLANPTPELMHKHGHSTDFPGPIITQVQTPSFFPEGMAPSAGCSFWIVEHPSRGMGLEGDTSPSFRPKTAQEFAAAVIACTIAPADYAALFESRKKMFLEQGAKLKDDPAVRSRLKEIAGARITPAETGKYVCRLVFNYPNQKGTMTTQIYLSKADLDDIRKLLKK